MSTVDRAGSVIRTNFALGSYEKFQRGFRDEKKNKDPGDEFWLKIRETKQTWRNTKIITFAPIIASATLKAVSLQLNGMLMMWKIRQAMQDDAIRAVRIHTAFIPVTGMTCLSGKISSPLTVIPVGKTEISGTELASRVRLRASPPSHMNTSKILKKDLRRDLGNRAHVKRPLKQKKI